MELGEAQSSNAYALAAPAWLRTLGRVATGVGRIFFPRITNAIVGTGRMIKRALGDPVARAQADSADSIAGADLSGNTSVALSDSYANALSCGAAPAGFSAAPAGFSAAPAGFSAAPAGFSASPGFSSYANADSG